MRRSNKIIIFTVTAVLALFMKSFFDIFLILLYAYSSEAARFS